MLFGQVNSNCTANRFGLAKLYVFAPSRANLPTAVQRHG